MLNLKSQTNPKGCYMLNMDSYLIDRITVNGNEYDVFYSEFFNGKKWDKYVSIKGFNTKELAFLTNEEDRPFWTVLLENEHLIPNSPMIVEIKVAFQVARNAGYIQ